MNNMTTISQDIVVFCNSRFHFHNVYDIITLVIISKIRYHGKEGIVLPVITISRQMCSFGDEVAEALSRRLGWELITRNSLFSIFPDIAPSPYDKNMLTESAKYYLHPCGDEETFLDRLTGRLLAFTERNPAILVGFGSQMIYAGRKDALHIRIIAEKNLRIMRARKQYHVTDGEAERILDTADRRHKKFVSTVINADLTDPFLYHQILNTSSMPVDECVVSVVSLIRERELTRDWSYRRIKWKSWIICPSAVLEKPVGGGIAKILDMYQIDGNTSRRHSRSSGTPRGM
jgi:cytidylate kinase